MDHSGIINKRIKVKKYVRYQKCIFCSSHAWQDLSLNVFLITRTFIIFLPKFYTYTHRQIVEPLLVPYLWFQWFYWVYNPKLINHNTSCPTSYWHLLFPAHFSFSFPLPTHCLSVPPHPVQRVQLRKTTLSCWASVTHFVRPRPVWVDAAGLFKGGAWVQ